MINGSAPYVMWATLIIFNFAIIILLKYSLQNIDLKEVLREKAQGAQPAAGAAGAAAVGAAPAAAAPAGQDNTSYSRVAGILGAIVLAAFFWATGDVILYKEFACGDANCAADVKELVSGLSTYVMSGAALFAPYAVNQLTNIFK
jgi:hypothetical protein